MKAKTCSVRDCEGVPFSLSLCSRHYSRLRRGVPLDSTRPPSISNPRRVVVVLPEALYKRIAAKADSRNKPASTFIREKLEEAFP